MKTLSEFVFPKNLFVTQNEHQSCNKFNCVRIMTVKDIISRWSDKLKDKLEFLIFRSYMLVGILFHCIMADRKKYVFKKLCLVLKNGTICMLLLEYSELLTGINWKRYCENLFL